MEITTHTTLDELLRGELRERGFAEDQHDTELTRWTMGGTTDHDGNLSGELALVELAYWSAGTDQSTSGQPTAEITVYNPTGGPSYTVTIDRTTPPLVAQAILRATLDGGRMATPVVIEAAQQVINWGRDAADAQFSALNPGQRAGHAAGHITTLDAWLNQPALPSITPQHWLLGKEWCVVQRHSQTGVLTDAGWPVSHPVAVQTQRALAHHHETPHDITLSIMRVDDLAAELLTAQTPTPKHDNTGDNT